MIITSDNYSEHSDHIGGKARELFRLAQKTGSVPPLFSVSAQSFHDFLCSRVDELREITSSNLGVVDISNRCRQLLEAESIDSQLADSILSSCIDGKLYSVRSSALQEDSDDHSFAGLFSTSLFVPKSKIIEQLRQCWLSAFSANIMEYCRINGIDPLDIRLGVVIQEMVDSVSSGVVFTANPTGSITEVAIVAGYGLGEGVVSNRVETDTYIYDKITNTLQKDVLRKTARLVFDKSSGFGVTQECVAADRSTVSVLDDEQIESLLAVVKTISDSFTQFLDIEWAMDNEGNIHVLQSRPITTIPKGRITVLDNNNIVESYPNVTLPLTASIAQKGYEKNFYNFFLSLNLPHAKARREVFRNLVGYVQGRLYYNLSNWYAMATLFPLPTRFTISSFDNMIGARHSSDFGSSRGEDGKSPFRALAFFATASWKFLCIRHYFKVFKDDFRALLRDYKSTNLEMLDNHQLIDLYSSAFTRFTEMAPNPLANDFFIMLFTGVTKRLLSSVALTDPDAVFNGLMCGEPGMDSVKPVHSVLHMAQLLRDDPKLYLQLKDNPRLLEEPSETIERREFLTAFNEHIELYGNRAPEELKMEVDTYKESPHLLLENILRYVPLDISAEKMATDELKIRRAAEKQLTNSLKGSP